MTKTVRYVVEITGDSGENINKHIDLCLERTRKIGWDVTILLVGVDEKSEYISSTTFPDNIVEYVKCNIFDCRVDAYFPSQNADNERLLEAYQAGVKVFKNDIGEYTELAWDDYFNGYLNLPDSEFYAKLFPTPVQVTEPVKLHMALGSTINPRAIILNAGLDNKGTEVSLGRGSHLGADALLNLGPTNLVIGNFSLVSANFAVHAMRHSITHISNYSMTKGPFSFLGKIYDSASPITIGNDVWIGEGVKCLSGVNIGNGCVVGAGSIVTKSLEPYGIYAGNPASLIRFRFEPEKIELLSSSQWWSLKFDRLKEIHENFSVDITLLELDELRAIF